MTSFTPRTPVRRWSLRVGAPIIFCLAALAISVSIGSTAPAGPTGLTAIAGDGSSVLAWQPVSGATGYKVYRTATVGGTRTLLTATPITTTRYVDSTAVNGTLRYYVVTAVAASGESPISNYAGATSQTRSCSTGNAIVLENCFPGTTNWKTQNPLQADNGGIEGFATSTSIDAGQSVDLKVRTTKDNVGYHVEIYRSGYYHGTQGRLISTVPGLQASSQPTCQLTATTGLRDCSTWSASATITTTADWPSGVYLLRIVRDDNGDDNHILLVVRHDSDHAAILYGVPTATYQAYNSYGGKSLYDFNSSGDLTVAGSTRAVSVSYDRPYQQSVNGMADWYPNVDVRNVSWLEQQGYDMSYDASSDIEAAGALAGHRVFLSPSHDEYWSAGMRSAITAARDAGTSLAFLGSNEIYWKIRYSASPVTGVANRVETSYKTVSGGAADPVTSTSAWRDPKGPNQPENALMGQMYVGDNDGVTFRYRVSDVQGHDTFWRRTSIAGLAAGTSATLGTATVGWEWDAPVENGAAPAGVTVLSGTPATGELIQNNGASYTNGSATTTSTRYQAASGALVFSSGTNNWSRGLGVNMAGSGEPNTDIEQATANLLVDMGVAPTTPAAGIVTEDPSALHVTDRSPAVNATDITSSSAVTATLDLTLKPSTVTSSTVTLTGPSGPVASGVSYDLASKTITLTPTATLKASTTYTVSLGGSIGTPWGTTLGSPVTWSFTTVAAPILGVTGRTPAPGATGLGQTPSITATFNLALDPATVNSTNVTLTTPDGSPVAATVSYAGPSRTLTITPSASLAWNSTYTATVTTGVQAADGTLLANPIAWSFSTASCPCSLITGTPARVHLPTTDDRSGSGPFSYELGTKIVATAPTQLVAIRYYRDSSETGTHIGHIWSSSGTLLASVTFQNETSSGWQQQALTTPLTLTVGQTYVVSVGINAYFVMTNFGLQSQIVNGPIATDVSNGQNGVIGSSAGVFPTASWQSSSYFVDAVAQ